MKKYIITLKEGLKSQIFEVTSENELYEKIDSGSYHILPVRAQYPIKITRKNIKEIVEITD